jgi:hypothetical protein
MKKPFIIVSILVVILIIAGGLYWYSFMNGPGSTINNPTGSKNNPGFTPFGRPGGIASTTGSTPANGSTTDNGAGNGNGGTFTIDNGTGTTIPRLRMLSQTPVGGYGASTTASTSVVRYIDRGKGNIYEARGNTLTITTLSNTLLPRMYDSVWNKNLTAFIGSTLDAKDIVQVVYAQLKPYAISPAKTGSSTTNVTPFELKGKNLPDNMLGYAVSPKKDKIFLLIGENGRGVGYTANFDGTSLTRIFDTPLTQLNIEWPEENTIALTTKGTITAGGFLYFVNPKTGTWKKILGPVPGLSIMTSHNLKYVIASQAGNNQDLVTSIYAVATTTANTAVIRTLADKCVWGNQNKLMVYCAVPSQLPAANYPDDWYRGSVTLSDKIWQVNAATGEVKQVAALLDLGKRPIDAINLGLDEKDGYLYFINKNDLTLWSLDLTM